MKNEESEKCALLNKELEILKHTELAIPCSMEWSIMNTRQP